MSTAQQAFAFLNSVMDKHGGAPSQWYAGIASDPRQRLFNDHNVSEHGDAWGLDYCVSADDARAVEEALLHMGCKGGAGGGDASTKAVYLYKIAPHTRE